jgi:membrane protease YdiL (CAAX protease family)
MLTEKPWKPESVLRYLMALFGSIFLGVLLVKWLNARADQWNLDPKMVTLVVGTLSFHGMALFLTSFFLQEHQTGWANGFGFDSPQLGRSVMLAVVVGLSVLPIIWSLGRLSAKVMDRFHFDPVVQETVQTLQTADSFELKMLIGFFAVIVAPVAEELVFRGILYPTVKQRGFPRLALWGTSILFAVIHSNAMIFLPLLFLAVILTLLYETTNNLLAPILTHSLFNLANFFWLISRTGLH